MAIIRRIHRAYVRHYRDNAQVAVYVEWTDTNGHRGRTEGAWPAGTHMKELLRRAVREGVNVECEEW